MKVCAKCNGDGWTEGLGDCLVCHGTGTVGQVKFFAPRRGQQRAQAPRHPEGNPFFDEVAKRFEIGRARP
jgi:DnaJ-class molecular chaperone